MDYADIDRVNSEIKMLNLKGKDYAMVPERVTAFRKIFPDGFISTEVLYNDGTTIMIRATAGYYRDGVQIVLGTGTAQEMRGKGMVNTTSHVENCETSAVGRALGMIGLGINGGGICSAEELANAITAQKQIEEEKELEQLPKPDNPEPPNATVDKGSVVPATKGLSTEQHFVSCCVAHMKKEINGFDFQKMRKTLVDEKAVADVKSEKMTMDEAFTLIVNLYKRFGGMNQADAKAKVSGMLDMFLAEINK